MGALVSLPRSGHRMKYYGTHGDFLKSARQNHRCAPRLIHSYCFGIKTILFYLKKNVFCVFFLQLNCTKYLI